MTCSKLHFSPIPQCVINKYLYAKKYDQNDRNLSEINLRFYKKTIKPLENYYQIMNKKIKFFNEEGDKTKKNLKIKTLTSLRSKKNL